MSEPIIPGQAITERIKSRELENNGAIQNFIDELTPYEQARFLQIAHHLVFLGFKEGVGRLNPEQQQYLRNFRDRETGKAYMRGFVDALSIIEEAQGSF